MSRTKWCSIAMALMLVACGDRPLVGPGPDANRTDAQARDAETRDGGADAGHDAAVDVGVGDAGSDSGVDAGNDAGLDAGNDGGFDAGTVIAPDGGSDAGHDGGMDSGFDAGMDAGHDAGNDGGSDAGSDAGHDVGIDATNDAGSDAPTHLGPMPVPLGPDGDVGTAAGYVVLAQTGISNVIGSMIGGNVGIHPGTDGMITGFSLVVDSSGQFSSSPSVVAPFHVYGANYSAPTPANLMSAVASMHAAYTNAATRTSPDFNNLAAGHIGGLALVPGLYHWTSSVDVGVSITLVGGANDVWIFQIDNGLDLGTSATMTLLGGAQARNVFWQVAGQVTTGPSSHFEGIILSAQSITMQTGASLHGRALAQTLVALDNDGIMAP